MISLDAPKVMGIVNMTPDSFYDGGAYNDIDAALIQVEKHLSEGATFIDIGGYSSRPGASSISVEEEINRVVPVVRAIHKKFPKAVISIDTFRSEVARAAISEGGSIINDISAGELDPKMFGAIIELNVPYIMMHMKKTPKDMQKGIHYDHLLLEIGNYFSKKVNHLHASGVKDIILDVGFGFAKTIEHNYQLLGNLQHFDFLKLPMLAGISRKSMLYKPLNTSTEQALNATTAANMIALQNGANLLRVHDVKEAMECVTIYNLTKQNS
ncbi:Dihydropteroate synthase [Parvicella tangerina]|uniref:Dihydropteroate synthase n=1 Tax=Parvicella tangerina TaxID=2829795 RepID=A0A916JND0_9FLAO|nr:Dihydropteroate synthase [Parvicella tangerina]